MGRSSFLIDTDYAEAFCLVIVGKFGVVNEKSPHVENELGRFMVDGTPIIVRSTGDYATVIAGRLSEELQSLYGALLKEYQNELESAQETEKPAGPSV